MTTAMSYRSKFSSLARERFLCRGTLLGAIALTTLGFWASDTRAEGDCHLTFDDRREILAPDLAEMRANLLGVQDNIVIDMAGMAKVRRSRPSLDGTGPP